MLFELFPDKLDQMAYILLGNLILYEEVLMNLERIWSSEESMKASTGLTLEEAKELLQDFSEERSIKKANRTGSGGRPECLDNQGIFTMTLVHYRHYLGFEMMALMFNISSSSAKRLFDECSDSIRSILKKKGFSHLIAPNRPKKSVESLSPNERFISMVLSNR